MPKKRHRPRRKVSDVEGIAKAAGIIWDALRAKPSLILALMDLDRKRREENNRKRLFRH